MTLTERYTLGDREHVALSMLPCVSRRRAQEQRHAFLHALHGSDGFRDMRAIRGDQAKASNFEATRLQAVDDFAEAHEANIFFGVASRATSTGRDIGACLFLRALFIDLDFKDSSESESRKRLAAFPFKFSALIFTGNGLHGYLFLTEPIDLRDEKGIWLARVLLRALV